MKFYIQHLLVRACLFACMLMPGVSEMRHLNASTGVNLLVLHVYLYISVISRHVKGITYNYHNSGHNP
jgi:hypothetical protein